MAWTTSTTTGSAVNELYTFVRGQSGSDFEMFDGLYRSTGWVGWQTYIEQGSNFVPSSVFVAVTWGTFRIDLFVRDSHYRFGGWLWHDAYDPHRYAGTWTDTTCSSSCWTGWAGQNFYAPPGNEVGTHLGVEALGYQNIDVVVQASPDELNYSYWHLCYCNNSWDQLPTGP